MLMTFHFHCLFKRKKLSEKLQVAWTLVLKCLQPSKTKTIPRLFRNDLDSRYTKTVTFKDF